jgi:hypothetical protein
MNVLSTKIRRALHSVEVAIADPADESLRDANRHAAEVLDDLDVFTLRPEVRHELNELTSALRTLRERLNGRRGCGSVPLASLDRAPRLRAG